MAAISKWKQGLSRVPYLDHLWFYPRQRRLIGYQSGQDFIYCPQGQCKCAPPIWNTVRTSVPLLVPSSAGTATPTRYIPCSLVSSSSEEVKPKSQDVQSKESSVDRVHPPEMDLYISEVKDRTKGVMPGKGPPPDPPTTCCMSGCANCVWISYADQLKDYYKDGGAAAREAIKEQVDDANLRAFLLLEMS